MGALAELLLESLQTDMDLRCRIIPFAVPWPSCMPNDLRNISFNLTWPPHTTKQNRKSQTISQDGEISKLPIRARYEKNIPFSRIDFYILLKAISEFHGNMNLCGHTIMHTFWILISFIFVILFIGILSTATLAVKATANGSFKVIKTTQRFGGQSLNQNSMCSPAWYGSVS